MLADELAPCNTREAIDCAVDRGVSVVRSHQKRLSRLLAIGDRIMDDLEREPVEGKKPLDQRERADLFRSLGQVLAKAIPLERQAFNLDERGTDDVIIIDAAPATGINEENL